LTKILLIKVINVLLGAEIMRKGVSIFLVSVSVIALILIGVSALIGVFVNQTNGERDISWIENVNEFIEELKPFPDPDPLGKPYPRSPNLFHMYENETWQLIWHGGTTDSVIYLKSLLNQVNNKINGSVTWDFIDKILTSNNVLRLEFRFDEDFRSVKTVQNAYFVLDDNLNMSMKGAIIIDRHIIGEGRFNIWEIT